MICDGCDLGFAKRRKATNSVVWGYGAVMAMGVVLGVCADLIRQRSVRTNNCIHLNQLYDSITAGKTALRGALVLVNRLYCLRKHVSNLFFLKWTRTELVCWFLS